MLLYEIWGYQRENTTQGMTLNSSTSSDPTQTPFRPTADSLSHPYIAGVAHPPLPKPFRLSGWESGPNIGPDLPVLL